MISKIKKMKTIAVIPARYDSSRFPGKLMEKLDGKSIIQTTYQAALDTGLFDQVIVATDSDVIFDEIQKNGGQAVMTSANHQTGSDRIAEVVQNREVDVIVNVQGDEPFITYQPLFDLIDVFRKDVAQEIAVASLMQKIKLAEDVINPNVVKVIVDKNNEAMYFSRCPIPYPRNIHSGASYYRHIGVYAFRKNALLDFSKHQMLPNEETEMIEAIRYLEYGQKIKMVESDYAGIGIDTPEDLEKAERYLRQ